MPATEETYRSQSTLHIVFAVSSIAMLLTTVWMIMADHLRPWKVVQREFHQVEESKLRVAEEQKLQEQKAKHESELERIEKEIEDARKLEAENRDPIRAKDKEIKKILGVFESLDTRTRFKKAELDSKRSEYDLIIDKGEKGRAKAYLNAVIIPTEQEYISLQKELEHVTKELDERKAELAALRGGVDEKIKRKEELTRDVDRVKRTLQQKTAQSEGFLALFRGLPVIDLAAPPEKIQQISLPELTINYNFKDVPRYDRCLTCHMGIDKLGYDKDANGKPMKETHPAFAAHPHLTDGATAIDPKGNVVPAGLYLDGNGPHKINSFGCTICHGGQGSGTSFTYASHTPNDLHQREEWTEKLGWVEIHHWDEPMLPKRFMEASCLKCHHQVTDIPQAKKLQEGYQRITKYGCTGCHTIGGEGAFGPDLTDNRQVGPNLAHVGTKVSKEWLAKWIRNPHVFRPDTRMPRFYDVTNNTSKADQPKVQAEVQAMAHYLIAVSTKPAGFVKPPAKGNADKGKTLFFEKGCMACHSHKDYPAESFPKTVQQYAKANFGPNLSNIAAKFASAEDGEAWLANWIKAPDAYHAKSLMPNLQLSMEDAADLASWLISVKPEVNDRWNDPSYLVDIDFQPKDPKKPTATEVVRLQERDEVLTKGLDELVKLYLSKSKSYKKKTLLLAEVDSTVAAMGREEKLMYVGERTISRLGCFGCHNIPGFETAKPIGTPLNGWGTKNPAKLDFAHIAEYLDDHQAKDDHGDFLFDGTDEYYKEQVDEHTRQGFLFQKLHRPRSYDYEKTKEDLKSWDDRLRMPQFAWAEGPGANEAIEEVMTFVLGLTGEKISSKYLPHYGPAKNAIAQGERLTNRYNCKGCHVFEMPKFSLAAAGSSLTDALVDLRQNVEVAYGKRNDDYLQFYKHLPGYFYDPSLKATVLEEALKQETGGLVLADSNGKPTGRVAIKASLKTSKSGKPVFVNADGRELSDPSKTYYLNEHGRVRLVNSSLIDANPDGKLFFIDKDNAVVDPKTSLVVSSDGTGERLSIEAMPLELVEDEIEPGKVERKLSIQLWRPVTIRGFTFNVEDKLTINPDKVTLTPAEGGDFAWLYARTQADKAGTDFGTFWNRLPPPLIREGKKVQTPWLTAFLKDPYVVRPAVNLRMPRFHLGGGPALEAGAQAMMPPDQWETLQNQANEATQKEASQLANYFAGVDGAEFPYQSIPERDRDYLAQMEAKHSDYLAGGWMLVTKGLCVGCHTIGQYKAAGGENVVNGPDLRQVAERFQPGYLYEWLGKPARLVPFTAMPQNIVPHPAADAPVPVYVPKSFATDQLAQVRAMRDMLLNYVSAVEQQLATVKPPEPPKPADDKKPTGGGE
jgi:cbb3-type cytochrome oxidase cytochrome c subunit